MTFFGKLRDERVNQVVVGLTALFVVSLIIFLVWAGRMIPGFVGEWFGVVAGVASTPFLMEASLLALGFLTVLVINHWRQRKDGDELVYLEQAGGPGSEALPEQAKWAIYKERPLEPEAPDLLVLAQGALDIGDYESALEAIAAMSDARRDQPDSLVVRISLARATGREALARSLEEKLKP